MITYTRTDRSNVSFLASFQTGLGRGQKSTISNIAVNISGNVSRSIQDSFQASSANALFGRANKLLPVDQLRQISTNTLTVVDANEPKMIEGDARFSVDSSVRDDSDQVSINLRQAAQVKQQMGLGAEDGSLESLARDLAVFGLDLTAMNSSPEELVETVRQRSLDLLDKLAAEGGSVAERNRITGASARLVNGIQSSAGVFFSVDSSSDVTVDGTVINGKAAYVVGSVVVDPLVLDLKGDGINLTSAEDGVEFDMDGDGVKNKMSFIQGDDALLFEDTYGDGLVHDGTQLFGNDKGHANGFEELRSHDDNGDGVIDKNDAVWDSLRVWVEKTADGVSEEGETMTLEEAGIESINVGYENVREDDGQGNLIGQIGSYQRADGSAGLAADAWFQNLGPAK